MPKKRRKAGPRLILRWGCKFLLVLLILSVLPVFSLKYVNTPLTFMTVLNWAKDGDKAGTFLPHGQWRPLKGISAHLRRAVLAGEDQRFLSHHGFDFIEMNQAIKDIFLEKGTRGASTITMQTARTVFLWPDRSLLRKLLEAYYTVLIEIFWSKERILEIYLNTVDWGDGIMGAEAASRRYFHVPSSDISRAQAALLAAILPSPHRWSPTNPNVHVLRRKRRILKDMGKMPLLSWAFENNPLEGRMDDQIFPIKRLYCRTQHNLMPLGPPSLPL